MLRRCFTKMYKITVGISCYEQKSWLYRCLRSLASQILSKNDFEVILVNDSPSESLEDICEVMKDSLNIRLINNEENLGLPQSLNKILKIAKGQYFVRIDSDDFVSKHFLYMLSAYLDTCQGKYQAVACDYKKVDEIGNSLGIFSSEKDPIACGIMFTYECLCSIGYYNEEFKMREGHELLKRLNSKYKMAHLELPLYRYRMHESNRTNSNEVEKYDAKLKWSN